MNKTAATDEANGALIQVISLSKDFTNGAGVIPVLREVNLQIFPGQMVAVMGPSGSGKSTLLYILGLLLQPSRGSYLLGGREMLHLGRSAQAECRRRRLGIVFPSCDLLENSTVYENLEFPLIYAGVERQQRPARIIAALEQVNLGHRVRHFTNHLSGGERQRVAVARALVNRPQVILADEPTGQLDRANGHLIMDHFQEIITAGNTAVVVVTHDLEIASRCNHTFSLVDGVIYET